jgi:hypothetical protein
VAARKMREATIGASVYLWSVDKNHFLQTNLQKTPSEKNVPNCLSVHLNVGDLLKVITTSPICVNFTHKSDWFSEI